MIVCFLLCFVATAQAQVSPTLWGAASLGASHRHVKTKLEAGRVTVKPYVWDQPGGLAAGMLAPPGLLSLLNTHHARNRLLSGMPKRGPRFLVAEDDTAVAVYAFMSGKLWAAGFAVKSMALAPTESPFDPNRLAPLARSLARIRAKCGGLQVRKRDDYGNAKQWRTRCGGGTMHATYSPMEYTPLRVLLVGR